MRIWLHTLGLLLTASLLASCGMRTAITPEADDVKAAEGVGMDAGMPCGFGPPCDPGDFGGRTCEMFGLGAGTLMCDPKTCTFMLKGCGAAPMITPTQTGTDMMSGTGGQGTVPGLFGDLGTGGAGGGFFGGGTGGNGGFPFFGGVPDGGFPFFGGGQNNNSDEDGGTPPNPGFFGGAFFGGQ